MQDGSANLGKLVSVHPIAPAYAQRAAFVTVLSFAFFVAMMVLFYLRDNIVFFILATAFLVLYLVMMLSLIMLRRNTVEVREDGFRFKKRTIQWSEIVSVSDEGVVEVASGKPVIFPRSAVNFEQLVEIVNNRLVQKSN